MEAVVPTEDVVQALMDCLVEPILPLKHSENDPTDLCLQQSVANQMHAVVLLYNYYHRKKFPQLEFLDFESFCKVAVNAKPSLLVHLNCMKKCNGDGALNNLSATEKAIIDACNISLGLDPLKDAPRMEGWPVSKIAIFLTDSMKENCALFFGGRTKGVWSLIEISDSERCNNSEGVLGAKKKKEMKRPSKWPVGVWNADEIHSQKLAMSAVKETTDIGSAELTILESHVAYSLSEEKTTARLFIMKFESVNENVFKVPIKDVIDSLQGPLVEKCCNSYIATDIVEYFHLLPYAGVIRDWFSREMLANGSVLLQEEYISKNLSPGNDEPVTTVTTEKSEGSFDIFHDADFLVPKPNTKKLDQEENGNYHASRHENLDEGTSSEFSHPSKETKTTSEVLVDNAATNFSTESDLRSTKSGSAVEEIMVGPVREGCNNDMDVDVGKCGPIVVSMQGPVVNDDECLDRIGPCSPDGARKVVGSSIERKRVLVFRHGSKVCNVDISKTRVSIHGEGDREEDLMLKELANIHFPSDEDPDKPLDSNDKMLLTDAILKVVNDEQTSSMIRSVQACKNWGETENIRVDILTRRNDLLGRPRKRQRVCFHDGRSESDEDTCSGELGSNNGLMTNDDVERLGQSAINNIVSSSVAGRGLTWPTDSLPDVVRAHQLVSEGVDVQTDYDVGCLDIGLDAMPIVHEIFDGQIVYAGEDEIQSPVIPQSMPDGVLSVGSVCFSQQYMELYQRIVARFGDVIVPESKEATLCGDIVSAAMKSLFELVDSMLQASPQTVDVGVVESWEIKLRFCEFARLKVGWLRDHFERIRDSSCLVQELKGRVTVLAECLEGKQKRAADLSNELEVVLADEKALLEQKVVVDADLTAARLRQEEFSFSLFN